MEHLFRPNSKGPQHLAKVGEALTEEAKAALPQMLWVPTVKESSGHPSFLGKNVHTVQAQGLSSSLSPFTHLGGHSRITTLSSNGFWARNLVEAEYLPWLDALALSSITGFPKPP